MINLLSFVMHSSCWWHLFCDTFRKIKLLFASVVFFVVYFGEMKTLFLSSFEYSKEHLSLYFMFKYISGHPNERSYAIHTSKPWSPLNNCSNFFLLFTLSLLTKRIRYIRVKCQSVVDLSFWAIVVISNDLGCFASLIDDRRTPTPMDRWTIKWNMRTSSLKRQ